MGLVLEERLKDAQHPHSPLTSLPLADSPLLCVALETGCHRHPLRREQEQPRQHSWDSPRGAWKELAPRPLLQLQLPLPPPHHGRRDLGIPLLGCLRTRCFTGG